MVLLGMVVFILMFIIIPGILTFNQIYWRMKGYTDEPERHRYSGS